MTSEEESSLGTEKSSGSASESEASSSSSGESGSTGYGSSGSSSSGSSSSADNPFYELVLDLFWTPFPAGKTLVLYDDDGNELPSEDYFISDPVAPEGAERYRVPLDAAYAAGQITTEAIINIYANHYLEGGEFSLLIYVTYNFLGDSFLVPVVPYKESGPPATDLVCTVTVLADGTFSFS